MNYHSSQNKRALTVQRQPSVRLNGWLILLLCLVLVLLWWWKPHGQLGQTAPAGRHFYCGTCRRWAPLNLVIDDALEKSSQQGDSLWIEF